MDDIRTAKADQIRENGDMPYASSFDRSHTLNDAREQKNGTTVQIAGRVVLFREMGKMTFATLQDHTGRFQIMFKEDEIGEEDYKKAKKLIDLGDFIGLSGDRFETKKGEPSVLVASWTMLTKALQQPPEKWHGIADQETAWRQRYLDMMSNRETLERFQFRSDFVRLLREFYWKNEFTEVETPVLVNAASGALATPFKTHHAAYDLDMYMRIAPETFLKECLIGGFDKVFEVARVFRNEGLDPSHLQDFTMVEHYSSYWDYKKNMKFTENLLSHVIKELTGSTKVKIPDRNGELIEVDFSPNWPTYSLQEIILKACGIDIYKTETADELRSAIKENKITLEVDIASLGRGNLIDQLYKKVCRPDLIQPTFITEHPIDLSPLARRNDDNPSITDRFQLVVGGWEIVNAYSELVDPIDQAQRFEDQATAHAGGDSDAHDKDDEYIKALEYGCPPCSGWGMGVDRIVALLTQQTNLRDVVLFPLMKPEVTQKNTSRAAPTETLLLEHADYGHLLPAAHGLLEEHTDATKAHLVATGAAMEALAKKFGGDEQTWKVAGMLHDLDWDQLDKDYEAHCGDTLDNLLKTIDAPAELLGDIRAHYQAKYGADYPLDTMLRKCLYCVDELTGFIIAVTLVRPRKAIADVEVKSVKKKIKDKGFAAQVDREQIRACEELLDVELDEFIQITLDAMKGVAEELGL
jgi:lysyl-tRNA synthetase class 2